MRNPAVRPSRWRHPLAALAALALVAAPGAASAQPAPPPPPDAPPAPAPLPPAPPAADFGVAPAALPPAPIGNNAPVPTVTWGNNPAPAADTTTTTPAPEKKFNPFYFTRFTWGNSLSAQTLGVGQGYQSPASTYDMSFGLNLRYYVLNLPLDKIYLNLNGSVTVEVTDSPDTSTTLEHQPLLSDLVLSAGYGHVVYESADKEWKTTPGVALNFALPTSLASQGQGKYLTLGVTGNIVQQVPLAGSKSDWFPDVLAFGSVGYSHVFSQCYTACNSIAAQYPKQIAGAGGGGDAAALTDRTDQLSASSLAIDKVSLNATYFLSLYKDLSFGNSWGIQMPFKHQFPATVISNPSTGNVGVDASTTVLNPVTTFDVSFSYVLFSTARIDIGYENVTPELLDNSGGRNSVFYSIGGATFYGNVALYIDNIIDRAMNPPDKKTALSLGRFNPSH